MKRQRLFTAFAAVAGLALLTFGYNAHSAPGDLYVPQATEGTILKFSPTGTKSTFVSGLDQPGGLAFDRSGNLFVSVGLTQLRDIMKITPGGELTVFATGISIPGGLAFDGAGNLYVTFSTGDTGSIWKFDPNGTKSAFGSFDQILESGSPFGLAFSPLGNLFATIPPNPFNFDGGIVWYEPDGTGHTFAPSGGLGLAFDSAGNLYEAEGDEITKFTPFPNYSQIVFASGFNGATGLAFDSKGNLFVAEVLPDETSSIQKVSPNGTKALFASGLSPVVSLAFEPVPEKLRNISARGLVGTGDGVLIGGFIVGGNALANNAVLVRAIGPSLSQAGVTNPLADPTLELHNSSGAVIASNDDWQETQEELITATGIPPTDPNESAIYASLPAGNYTAVVRGAGDTTGTALVEVYSLQ
jgi:sugar lactone lactonase YvrE